jgi:hypothetical protein
MSQNEVDLESIDSNWEHLTNVQKKEVKDRTDLLLNCFKSSSSFLVNFKYFMDQKVQKEDHLGNQRFVFKNMIDCLFFKILELDAENTVNHL